MKLVPWKSYALQSRGAISTNESGIWKSGAPPSPMGPWSPLAGGVPATSSEQPRLSAMTAPASQIQARLSNIPCLPLAAPATVPDG